MIFLNSCGPRDVPLLGMGSFDVRTKHRARILVVDDDPIVLEVTKERLESAGYDVYVRDQALGTTPWLMTHEMDFVLLDVCMPGLSGGELAQLLRSRTATRRVRVILHSSLAAEDVADLMRTTGAVGAIAKGGDAARFLSLLADVVTKCGPADRRAVR